MPNPASATTCSKPPSRRCYILYLVLSNFSLLTGFESFAVNLFIGGLMFIVGVIGYLVAVFKDKKGALVDPVSIDVEEEAASEA